MEYATRAPDDIRRDLADVERYLEQVPPHSGTREPLEDSLTRLRAELKRSEAERAGSAG